MTITTDATTTLSVVVRRHKGRSDHTFIVSRPLKDADILYTVLSDIANDGTIACRSLVNNKWETEIKIAIMKRSGSVPYLLAVQKLVAVLAAHTHTTPENVLVVMEGGFELSLDQLQKMFDALKEQMRRAAAEESSVPRRGRR